jgi:hypothetical protein
VSQISVGEAGDLLSKLLTERIPLRTMFLSRSGARIMMPGFVDSITPQNGLGLSVSGPPIDVGRGFINVRPFDRDCDFTYSKKRELPEDTRRELGGPDAESVLIMRFPDFGEMVTLFFTL